MTPDKKVKILATLGPATRGLDDVRALVEAGVNIFRLNFSHGEHAEHARRFEWIREVERQLNYPLGILMDLQGPKLRIGRFAEGKVQLARGLELAVDWVALSLVQRPEDIREARELIGGKALLMAKIEKPSAVTHLREIAELSDAIMVARGDLGVEVPAESVPQIQKDIIGTCRQLGRPVVVATQMLESMRFAPTPTRAEVTDATNAVAEGADAVMLSAETASGDYPLEAVQMMSKIIRQVESGPDYQTQLDVDRPQAQATVSDAISCAIRRISRILPVAALVNYSESGASSLRAARERPAAPILNLTPNVPHGPPPERGLGRALGGQRPAATGRRSLLDGPGDRPGPGHGAAGRHSADHRRCAFWPARIDQLAANRNPDLKFAPASSRGKPRARKATQSL